jgi:hypothetical protein
VKTYQKCNERTGKNRETFRGIAPVTNMAKYGTEEKSNDKL